MHTDKKNTSILPFIWFLIQPHKKKMLVGLLALVSVNLLLLTTPLLIAKIIDTYNASIDGTIDIRRVIYLSGVLLGVSLVIFGLRLVWRFFLIVPSYAIKKTNKAQVFKHILSLSPQSLRKYTVGEQISLISRETEQISNAISWGTLALADGLLTIVAVYAILIFNYGAISWASLLVYPLSILFVYSIWSRIGRAHMIIQEHIAQMSELTREMLQNIATIKSFNSESYYITRFLKRGNQIIKAKMRISLLEGLLWPMLTVLSTSALILALYLSIPLIKTGQITLGDLSAVLNYLLQVQMPFMGLSFALDIQQKGLVNAKRVRALLDTKTTLHAPSSPATLHSTQGELCIKNMTFTYPDPDTHIDTIAQTDTLDKSVNYTPFTLGPITLSIPYGLWLGVTGKIGSGKSTLAYLLARMYDVTSGSIEFNNVPIHTLSLEKLRSTILLQPQIYQLFSWSVAQNIVFIEDMLTEEEMSRAQYFGKYGGLSNDIVLFPQRWNTLIGESGILLSGGQKQRVVLSRSLVESTPVLVLDDIFSGLDYNTAQHIVASLRQLRAHRTTILISHNLSILSNTDTIIVLDNGKIVEQGSHNQLINAPRSLYNLSWNEYLITQGQKLEQ